MDNFHTHENNSGTLKITFGRKITVTLFSIGKRHGAILLLVRRLQYVLSDSSGELNDIRVSDLLHYSTVSSCLKT